MIRFPFLGDLFATDKEKEEGIPSAPGTSLLPGQGIPLPDVGPGGVPMIVPLFSSGALIPTLAAAGMSMGTDKVPALLTPGEVVINKPTVDAVGAEPLLALNKQFGGPNANRPKFGMISGYQGGGFVISAEERRMLDAISGAEGTGAGYGTLYGGGYIPELGKGEMSINQVLKMQETGLYKGRSVYAKDQYDSTATGRYQFMPIVLREEANKAGYDLDKTKFTPRLQDELILRRIRRMRGVTPELLKSEGMSDRVIDMLAPEFASFPNLFGPDARGRYGTNSSYYGQGGKSAEFIRNLYDKSNRKGNVVLPTLPSVPNVPTRRGSLAPAYDTDKRSARERIKLIRKFNFEQRRKDTFDFIFNILNKVVPVSTPNVSSSTSVVVLPPIKQKAKQETVTQNIEGIPDFKITSGVKMRGLVGKALGIEDLVS